MDREALRKAAASRRAEATPEKASHVWRCDHCLRDFQTENGFMKHFCVERDKLERLQSPQGQAAYAMYSEWMRLQRRSVPPASTFMVSKQFNYFMQFALWSEKTAIPNVNQFIKLMVDSGTQPVLWCRTATYMLYLEWYDNTYPPEQQFVESFDLLHMLATDHHCTVQEIYTELGASEIAKLVRRRKLSPWLLVASRKFLMWVSSLPQVEREILNGAIDFAAFAKKINQQKELAADFGRACEAEGI